MNRLDSVDKAQLRTDIPDFAPGDTVRVHVRIKESETKERLQAFEGIVIGRIEVVRRGRVRRAKLYYLRNLRGKAARIRERDTRQATTGSSGQAQGASASNKSK